MTAYNAKHPYEPDWQIPRGVWANGDVIEYVSHYSYHCFYSFHSRGVKRFRKGPKTI